MNETWTSFWKATAPYSEAEMTYNSTMKARLREALCEYLDEGHRDLLFSDMMTILLAEGNDLLKRAKEYHSFMEVLERGVNREEEKVDE